MKRSLKASPSGVSARLRQARELLEGVPVERLERAAKLPPGRLAAIEAGEAPTAEEVERLADKLKRYPSELLEGPLQEQTAKMKADAQRLIGNSQGGRQAESWTDPEERVRLARNIRFYREAAGLSQTKLAHALGIATPNISVFENPEGDWGPSAATLEKMATVLDTTAEHLRTAEHPVVVRTKVAGDVSALSAERRDALAAEVAAFEKRMTRKYLDELAEHGKRRRK